MAPVRHVMPWELLLMGIFLASGTTGSDVSPLTELSEFAPTWTEPLGLILRATPTPVLQNLPITPTHGRRRVASGGQRRRPRLQKKKWVNRQ